MPPLPRPNESTDTLRARLVYQSRKRGTLESDLLLSTFARDFLGKMTHKEMQEYDKVRFLTVAPRRKRMWMQADEWYDGL